MNDLKMTMLLIVGLSILIFFDNLVLSLLDILLKFESRYQFSLQPPFRRINNERFDCLGFTCADLMFYWFCTFRHQICVELLNMRLGFGVSDRWWFHALRKPQFFCVPLLRLQNVLAIPLQLFFSLMFYYLFC